MKPVLSCLLIWLLVTPAYADTHRGSDPEALCKAVNFGVVDWTDLHVANGIAKTLLERLGYEVTLRPEPATPNVFQQMQDDNIDVFLGYWTPAMVDIAKPYYQSRSVKTLTANLNNARWTLAVPNYVYEQGLRDFADIARFSKELDGRIYGLEKGSSGNAAVLDMINTNAFGLQDFRLIETSERLMLAQVNGRVRKQEWIVFLGWAPHPMNQHFDMKYLSGGDDYFGPEYGKAAVNTSIRRGLDKDCPNLARFLNNLIFEASIEEAIMDQVSNEFVPVDRAVRIWMNQNPDQVAHWLKGVTTLKGNTVNPTLLAEGMALTFGR